MPKKLLLESRDPQAYARILKEWAQLDAEGVARPIIIQTMKQRYDEAMRAWVEKQPPLTADEWNRLLAQQHNRWPKHLCGDDSLYTHNFDGVIFPENLEELLLWLQYHYGGRLDTELFWKVAWDGYCWLEHFTDTDHEPPKKPADSVQAKCLLKQVIRWVREALESQQPDQLVPAPANQGQPAALSSVETISEDTAVPVVNREQFCITFQGKTCILGNTKEFQVFELLNRRRGKLVSYRDLSNEVWGIDGSTDINIQRTVSNLRSKLCRAGMRMIMQIDGSTSKYYRLVLTTEK